MPKKSSEAGTSRRMGRVLSLGHGAVYLKPRRGEIGLRPHRPFVDRPQRLPPGGHRPLLTDPGLGITIDEDKLLAQVGEPRPYRTEFDPDDGSVRDW